MNALKGLSWEAVHVTALVATVAILALAIHLLGTPRSGITPAAAATTGVPRSTSSASIVPAHSPITNHPSGRDLKRDAPASERSDPLRVTVGMPGISNRYTLVHIDRKPISPSHDALTIRLHVESLAMENAVSPFDSDMLELSVPGQAPLHPMTSFRHPVPSGNSRNQDVVFQIPTDFALDRTTLQIHYYNYQNEIPLALPARAGAE